VNIHGVYWLTARTVLSLSALLLNNLIVLLLTRPLSAHLAGAAYAALLAKACATAVGLSWNYLANSLWTFRDMELRSRLG
jgi:putative flippase GtrA